MKKTIIFIILLIILFVACDRNDLFKISQKTAGGQLINYIAAGTSGQIWMTDTLTDGNWVDVSVDALNNSDLIFGNSKLVISGGSFPPADNGFIKTSGDGLVWTVTTPVPSSKSINRLIFADNRYVAIGDDGGNRQIWFSADAANWTVSAALPAGIYNASFNLKGIAYGNGRYVIAGGFSMNGETMWSPDAVNWTITSPNCSYMYDVAFGNNLFVMVGKSSEIQYSADNAVTWTSAGIAGNDLNSIAYSGSRFVTVGASGQIWISDDGTTWLDKTTGAETYNRVIFAIDRFILAGNNGTVMWSFDGETWNNISPGGSNLTCITFFINLN